MYVRQVGCVNRLLRRFVDRLRDAGRYADTVIIIHGDHGARINRNWPTVANREKLLQSDFLDGYPTLFAVKAAASGAGYSSERETLPVLLARTIGRPDLGPTERRVFLFNGRRNEMEATSMPAVWMTGGTDGESGISGEDEGALMEAAAQLVEKP